MESYIPEKGDFIILTFDPQSGNEQKGRRPAIVVSNYLFNKHTRLAIVCPITNTFRNIPFHITISGHTSLTGHVMAEQVKSIDYKSRKVKFVEKADKDIINKVLSILDASIF
jgi:mRNA interferase MazF